MRCPVFLFLGELSFVVVERWKIKIINGKKKKRGEYEICPNKRGWNSVLALTFTCSCRDVFLEKSVQPFCLLIKKTIKNNFNYLWKYKKNIIYNMINRIVFALGLLYSIILLTVSMAPILLYNYHIFELRRWWLY